MATPTRAMQHVDAPLTNISVAYIQSESAFIADKVFPMVPVKKESDRYFVYTKDDWFRDEAAERGPATESAGGGYTIDNTPSYFAKKYSYHKDVTERDRANSDTPLNADRDATLWVTQKLLIRREVQWANQYFRSGIWANEYGGAGSTNVGAGDLKYWNQTGSAPIVDVHRAQIDQQKITGYKPNVLVLSAAVFNVLQDHDTILERIKYTERGIVTTDLLAALFGVEKVLVAEAVKNAAAKGATGSYDFIMGKNALLAYAAKTPSLMNPSAGYTFSWTGLLGAGAYGNVINRIPMDWLEIGTERIEGDMAFDQKLVAADMGTFFDAIIE